MTLESNPIFRCTSRDGRHVFDILPGQSVRVGSSAEHSDVVIDSNMISKRKAVFHNQEGECTLEYGLNPPCPIWVNGEPVPKDGIKLNIGDSIKFNFNLIFEFGRLDEAGNLEPHEPRLPVFMQPVYRLSEAGNLERRTLTQRPIQSYDETTNTTRGTLMLLLLVFVVAVVLWVVIVMGLRLTFGS